MGIRKGMERNWAEIGCGREQTEPRKWAALIAVTPPISFFPSRPRSAFPDPLAPVPAI